MEKKKLLKTFDVPKTIIRDGFTHRSIFENECGDLSQTGNLCRAKWSGRRQRGCFIASIVGTKSFMQLRLANLDLMDVKHDRAKRLPI
jgi:hypothetical protein